MPVLEESMSSDPHSLSLFSNDAPDFSWEPTDAEIAIALELNTLNSFRTQFRRLKTRYRSFGSMLDAGPDDLAQFPDWAQSHRERLLDQVSHLKFGTEFRKVPGDVTILTFFDRRYPHQLREIYDPPPLLYVKGDLTYDFTVSMSIVGTRSNTEYGRSTAEQFAYQLASWGFTIVSGGARGIDSIAHSAALEAGGKTVAVLGSGIDVIFPAENQSLFAQIAESGAVVTEFPMGAIPEKYNFPARNRIIAALGRATLIVEAAEKSGALITADLACQNGRDVFAVPGRLTDGRSKGTNMLIHDGAHIALDPSDIPVRFGLTVLERDSADSENAVAHLEGDEALVYNAIGLEAKDTDVIVRELGIPAHRILSALLLLQMRGLVKELPGSRFVRPVRSLGKPLPADRDRTGQ